MFFFKTYALVSTPNSTVVALVSSLNFLELFPACFFWSNLFEISSKNKDKRVNFLADCVLRTVFLQALCPEVTPKAPKYGDPSNFARMVPCFTGITSMKKIKFPFFSKIIHVFISRIRLSNVEVIISYQCKKSLFNSNFLLVFLEISKNL